jgi:hypothetical protein
MIIDKCNMAFERIDENVEDEQGRTSRRRVTPRMARLRLKEVPGEKADKRAEHRTDQQHQRDPNDNNASGRYHGMPSIDRRVSSLSLRLDNSAALSLHRFILKLTHGFGEVRVLLARQKNCRGVTFDSRL